MSEKFVSQIDADGYFLGPVKAIASPLEPGQWQLPAGAVDVQPPVMPDGYRAKWSGSGFELIAPPPPQPPVEPPPPPPPLTQRELDELRFKRRASVQSDLIAWMAADNMSRVRSGAWTVTQLTSLMSDPALQAANAYMSTLSYELAAQSISQASNALMTPAIKASWVAKLTEHFYLEP